MTSNLLLRSLLDSEKLMGPNFDNWYQKLKIILEYERILCPYRFGTTEPAPNAQGAIRDTYLKWLNDRTIVYCIMQTTMNDEFSRKFEEAQPEDMLKMLNESFGTPNDIEWYKISCAIFNAWMREGVSVIDHILYMIEPIEHLSKLDFFLHE